MPAKCDINYNLYTWGHLAGAKGAGQPERVCAGRGSVTDRVRFPDTGVGKRGSVREQGPPGVRVWRRDCLKFVTSSAQGTCDPEGLCRERRRLLHRASSAGHAA